MISKANFDIEVKSISKVLLWYRIVNIDIEVKSILDIEVVSCDFDIEVVKSISKSLIIMIDIEITTSISKILLQ